MYYGIFAQLGKDRREILNAALRRRNIGNIPPPYPNGWYEVMRSCDLPKKAVKAVSVIGQNFAVFRGESGNVSSQRQSHTTEMGKQNETTNTYCVCL